MKLKVKRNNPLFTLKNRNECGLKRNANLKLLCMWEGVCTVVTVCLYRHHQHGDVLHVAHCMYVLQAKDNETHISIRLAFSIYTSVISFRE